jgi:hypothetical protein
MTQAAKTRSQLIRILTLLALAGGVYYFADIGKIGEYLLRVPLGTALTLICMEFAFYAVESFRLKSLSQKRYPANIFFKSRLVSGLVSNFLPGLGVGDVVRVLMIDAHRPGHKFYLLLLILASRLYGLMSLAVLLFIPFVFGISVFADLSSMMRGLFALICVLVAAAPLIFITIRMRRLLSGIYRQLKQKRLKALLRTIYLALARFGLPKVWFMATTTSVLTSAIVVVQYWIVAKGMGLGLDLTVWMITVPLVSIVAFLPIGFGAFGSQDAGLLLASQILQQPAEVFLAISAVIHASRICGTLPGLLFCRQLTALKIPILQRKIGRS